MFILATLGEVLEVITNNGLGVMSFLALLYFMNTSLKEIKQSTEKISDTLVTMQASLIALTERVSDLEHKKGSD